ncbi:hypothetical protein A2872_04250 [Candidatus Gottesmanbacteria bacterium RIFCSPHIGHO2_01_FULL_42_12]|uniref:Methyltransferase type 11 domain-containing protein n=1 Tax=Candidatus Gottesmanbacteria bacterium RIFCSPHIGHO2_01_FULL_42_12 TaxID=1798377 RepID=A0A1F5Z208_9BACT|nr:MAG: hypothetical protein A2872_04250 [Candidatus Gottesmanbacteria bacterium RIFCSPHIGHO2_01_FULL_42_12]
MPSSYTPKNLHNTIINYYDLSEPDYKLVLGLKKNMAMHYGYWDKSVHSLSGALAKENDVLATKAKITKNSLVLDAGCGVGGSAIYLAKKYGCKVIGITLSSAQVSTAKKNATKAGVAEKVKFYPMDYLKTTFKNKSFDVVWAIESVCHAEDKKAFIKEAHRLLKINGRLVVADGFFTKNSYTLKEDRLLRTWLNGWGVETLATVSDFSRDLKAYDFKNITFTNIDRNIFPSSVWLYVWSLLGLTGGKLLGLIGFRNKIQSGNVIAANLQFRLLFRHLWEYGYFCAETMS